MNEQAILDALFDGTVVKVVFNNDTTQQSLKRDGSYSFDIVNGKQYSYKSKIDGLKFGDLVVVETTSGFKVVTVVEVTDALDLNPAIEHKWVVSKVDVDAYNQIKAQEAELVKELRRQKRANVRNQLLVGVNTDELNRILKIASQGE